MMNSEAFANDKVVHVLEAIKKGNLTEVKLLIQDGADVNRKLPPSCPLVGKSLLYAAALLDNYEAVEILLENGAEIRLTGLEDEDTPDDQMCSKLERRRNSNYESADGERKPLDEATLYAVNAKLCPVDPVCGNSNGQILKLMSSYTTELKHISLLQPEELRSTQPHFNLLQNYCTWNNSHVSSERQRDFVRTLVEDVGIDVNGCPYPGLTALFIACKYHHSPAVVHELLGLGARVNDHVNGRLPIDVLLDSEGTENNSPWAEGNIVDVFNLLISYGSSIQHNCVSSLKISNESDEELTKPTTLLFRLCNNDNIPGAKLKEAINNLSQAGYNFSRDNFLKKESHPAVNKLKEDNPFYKSLMKRMTRPVSLFLQCRRAVVKALGDPYRNKVQLLSNIAVPKLIIAFLQFSDLYCSCSAFIKGPLI